MVATVRADFEMRMVYGCSSFQLTFPADVFVALVFPVVFLVSCSLIEWVAWTGGCEVKECTLSKQHFWREDAQKLRDLCFFGMAKSVARSRNELTRDDCLAEWMCGYPKGKRIKGVGLPSHL
jgi:hypothetical protein